MFERKFYHPVPADDLAEAGIAEPMVVAIPNERACWRGARFVVRASYCNETGKEVPFHQIGAFWNGGGGFIRTKLVDDGTYSMGSGADHRARLTAEQSDILTKLATQSVELGVERVDKYFL